MFDRNVIALKCATPVEARISLLEYATFSSLAYDIDAAAPPGWEVFSSMFDPQTGYHGVAYARNLLSDKTDIIITHRGTVLTRPDGFKNIYADLQVALERIPVQFNSMEGLSNDIRSKIFKVYRTDEEKDNHIDLLQYVRIMSTGHSLGAVISDGFSLLNNALCPSVTFENPGSKNIMEKYYTALGFPDIAKETLLTHLKSVCQVYQGGVNLINTWNEQLGTCYRFTSLEFNYNLNLLGVLRFPPSHSCIANLTYLMDYTPDQYVINKIIKYLTNNTVINQVENPSGHLAGYREYVNPANKEYWKKYMRTLWRADTPLAAIIRLKYSNEDEFVTHGYQQLAQIYQDLSKLAEEKSDITPRISQTSFGLFKRDKMIDEIISEFELIEKPDTKETNVYTCAVM